MKYEFISPQKLFPKQAIKGDAAESVAGRRRQIDQCLQKISNPSDCLMIIGERGVGKTTVAWQVLSVIEGANAQISGERFSRLVPEEHRFCIFIKANPALKSIGELILYLMAPSERDHSFSTAFQYIYAKNSAFDRKLQAELSISLASLATLKVAEKDSSQSFVREMNRLMKEAPADHYLEQLLTDLVTEIGRTYRNPRIFVFIDEADTISDIEDLGGFIKRVNGIQFIFVGIAETRTQIIKQHQSAGRKVEAVMIPALEPREVQSIFSKAVEASNTFLEIEDEFVNLCITYSGGFPWIVQGISNKILTEKIYDADTEDPEILIEGRDFDAAFDSLIDSYEDEFNSKVRISEALSDTGNRIVLEVLLSSHEPMLLNEIRSRLPTAAQSNAQNHLNKLMASGLVVSMSAVKKYKFKDPIVRMFVKRALDKECDL